MCFFWDGDVPRAKSKPPEWKSKDNPGCCEGLRLLCWGKHTWVWQAVGKKEVDKDLLPQNLPGVTQFPSGKSVSRKVPLELMLMKCIILKCISCGTPGARKAGTGTHPELLCSWRAATSVTPSLCFWQLEIPPGRSVSLWKHVCVKQDQCFCRQLSFCFSQTVRARMEMSFCVWPQQICPFGSSHLLCPFSEGPGCICRVWYPWCSRQCVPAQSCTNMKGFFN